MLPSARLFAWNGLDPFMRAVIGCLRWWKLRAAFDGLLARGLTPFASRGTKCSPNGHRKFWSLRPADSTCKQVIPLAPRLLSYPGWSEFLPAVREWPCVRSGRQLLFWHVLDRGSSRGQRFWPSHTSRSVQNGRLTACIQNSNCSRPFETSV